MPFRTHPGFTLGFLTVGLSLLVAGSGKAADPTIPGGPTPGVDQTALRIAAAPKDVTDQTEATGVPAWGLGPFVRCPDNPLISPRSDTMFFCPIQKMNVPWEGKNIVGAAAAVKDGKVYWLYRAEPINIHNSRVGLGVSEDGIHFQRSPTPVIYPDEDAFKKYEWPGGTEDGRIVQREDGLFIYLYAAYDGHRPRQSVATSRDLVHWDRQGWAFLVEMG